MGINLNNGLLNQFKASFFLCLPHSLHPPTNPPLDWEACSGVSRCHLPTCVLHTDGVPRAQQHAPGSTSPPLTKTFRPSGRSVRGALHIAPDCRAHYCCFCLLLSPFASFCFCVLDPDCLFPLSELFSVHFYHWKGSQSNDPGTNHFLIPPIVDSSFAQKKKRNIYA